jgi:hypothetical protein
MSVRLSVCPRGKAGHPVDVFLWFSVLAVLHYNLCTQFNSIFTFNTFCLSQPAVQTAAGLFCIVAICLLQSDGVIFVLH